MEPFYEKGKKYNFRVKGVPYFRTSVTINGKVHQIYGDGEKDAIRKKEALVALSKTGVDVDRRKEKLGVVFQHWLYNVKRVSKQIKPSTFTRYESSFRNHVLVYDIVRIPLSSLKSSILQEYITALYEEYDVSSSSIKETFKVWKMFAEWAVNEGYLQKNPCDNVELPGEYKLGEEKIEFFSTEERQRMLAYMSETGYTYDTLIKFAFATGMRQGEILALRWDDIYDNAIHVQYSTAKVTYVDKEGNRTRKREVWEPKTINAKRTIPIIPETAKLLSEHRLAQKKYFFAHRLGTPSFVFTTENGTLIDARVLARSFQRMQKRAGIEYKRFHCIRHTFATEAIRRGVDVKDLQLLMGHSELETTYRYVQSDNESRRQAITLMGQIM